VHILRDVIPKL